MTDLAVLFASLEGEWALHKTILHGDMSPERHRHWVFEGTARYQRADAQTLLYRETGNLIPKANPAAPQQAWQDYIFSFDGNVLQVFFARGAERQGLFLTFSQPHAGAAGVLTAQDRHQCAEDLYKATLQWDGASCHRLEYIVRGPRKDYTSTNVFTRRDFLKAAVN